MWKQGSITDANPGLALYNVLESDMISMGWELVDTVIVSTITHKILKSPAAGNTYGLDWYLDINFPTTGVTGGFRFAAFEGWNATTHLGTRGPVWVSGSPNTTVEQTYYSLYGNTGYSAEAAQWANGPVATGMTMTLNSSAFTYWMSVNRNRIYLHQTNDTSCVLYCGFYTPTTEHAAYAGASLFPLVTAKMSTSSGGTSTSTNRGSHSMSLNRVPKFAASGSMDWGGGGTDTTAITQLQSAIIGGGTPGGGNGKYILTPIVVRAGLPSLSGPATEVNQTFMGTLDGVATASVYSTLIRGDNVFITPDNWYMSTPQGSSPARACFLQGV